MTKKQTLAYIAWFLYDTFRYFADIITRITVSLTIITVIGLAEFQGIPIYPGTYLILFLGAFWFTFGPIIKQYARQYRYRNRRTYHD